MKKSNIEDLAYLIKESKNGKPIVFLGAGASSSAGIPLADEISNDILLKYKDNPKVRRLSQTDIHDYKKLMECLLPDERNKLLKEYIDKAQINVTHIYLAQLIYHELIDYVLTVNFDNLMLRALALFNIFPPTYDMAILKDITTTTFYTKSVIYLHGQHHGLWLLNTEEELNKVKEVIPPILNSIKDRPWIFIGYRANDPIFEHITNLGRFDKGLYWISRKTIPENVKEKLLEKSNTNSFLIEGYDSDTFMLKLNAELKLGQPDIFDKPFSYLKQSIENIININSEEHFKDVKQRLEISKDQIDEFIKIYERNEKVDENHTIKNDIAIVKKEIIEIMTNEEYDEERVANIYNKSLNLKDKEINLMLSRLYNDFGNMLYNSAKSKNYDEEFYNKAFKKYEIASKLNPKDSDIFYNWGTALANLAKIKNDDETLYNEAFGKYKIASDLNPNDSDIFYNWGIALANFAKTKNNDEILYNEAFEKSTKAFELGAGSYDLACHYSLRNNKEKVLELLEQVLKNDEISISHIETDEDWDNLKEDNDFKELIKKYKKES